MSASLSGFLILIGWYYLCGCVIHGADIQVCNIKDITIREGDEGEITLASGQDHRDCKLHLTTCPRCRIRLKVVHANMQPCLENLPSLISGCQSSCQDFISVHEPGYDGSTTMYIHDAISSDFVFKSLTRRVFMQFCMSGPANISMKYYNEDKTETFNHRNGMSNVLTSPRFPSSYQQTSDTYKYVINNTDGGYIHLEFTDWDMYSSSKLTIYHQVENGHSLTRYGNESRPFVKSQGSVLIIVFETGTVPSYFLSQQHIGFRANFTFTAMLDWPQKPFNYDCGKYFAIAWGGDFHFDSDICPANEIVDCIWVVMRYPVKTYSRFIWLRITDVLLGIGDIIQIRSGNNSQGTILKHSDYMTYTSNDFVEVDAIYIHIRVTCRSDRKFNAVFASYDNAIDGSSGPVCNYPNHFACSNKRCIDKSLKCDIYNHCSDWSDETICHDDAAQCHLCNNGRGTYCKNDICDGTSRCEDDSDEKNCIGDRSTQPPVEGHNTHYYWGTITPVVLICLILGIITCIVISFYIRRKRLLQERGRCLNRTRATALQGGVIDSFGLAAGIYGVAPPSYDESLLSAHYIPGQGTVNTAFDVTDFPDQPPPYTPKCEAPMPSHFLPPYVADPNIVTDPQPLQNNLNMRIGENSTSPTLSGIDHPITYQAATASNAPSALPRSPEPQTRVMDIQDIQNTLTGKSSTSSSRAHSESPPNVPTLHEEDHHPAEPHSTEQALYYGVNFTEERGEPEGGTAEEGNLPITSSAPANINLNSEIGDVFV